MFDSYYIDLIKNQDVRFKLKDLIYKHKVEYLTEFDRDLLDIIIFMFEDLDRKIDRVEDLVNEAESAADTATWGAEEAENKRAETQKLIDQIPTLLDRIEKAEHLIRQNEDLLKANADLTHVLEGNIKDVADSKKIIDDCAAHDKTLAKFRDDLKSILDELVAYLEKPKRIELRGHEETPIVVLKLRSKISELEK